MCFRCLHHYLFADAFCYRYDTVKNLFCPLLTFSINRSKNLTSYTLSRIQKMKGTYMQAFKTERIAIDTNIAEYFNQKLFGANAEHDDRYDAFLKLIGMENNEKAELILNGLNARNCYKCNT